MLGVIDTVDNHLVGIYMIKNLENNKSYIGKSKNVRTRLKQHYRELTRGEHVNYLLQHDFNLFGEDAFSITILQECIEEELSDYESLYCHENNVWNKGYNIAKLRPTTNIKTKNQRRKDEFISYLNKLNNLIDMVNSSKEDIVTDFRNFAECAGLKEEVARKLINTMTPENKKQLPFVMDVDSRGIYGIWVRFSSKSKELEERKRLAELIGVL